MINQLQKRLIILIVLAFLLFNISYLFNFGLVKKLSQVSVFKIVFYPSIVALNLIDYTAKKIEKLRFLSQAYDLMLEERKKRVQLEAENQLLLEQLKGLEKIANLDKEKKSYPYLIEVTKVIGRNPLFWHQYILIDGGEDRGFGLGMPVIAKEGLVGKIVEVYRDYSKVLLLVDPTFSVDVRGVESNVLALCSGIGSSLIKVNYVPRFEELKVGELLITSGLDRAFPEGIPVGYILEVNKPFGSYFLDAYVVPVVDVLKIKELMVVKNFGLKR